MKSATQSVRRRRLEITIDPVERTRGAEIARATLGEDGAALVTLILIYSATVFDLKIADKRWSIFRRILPSVSWLDCVIYALPFAFAIGAAVVLIELPLLLGAEGFIFLAVAADAARQRLPTGALGERDCDVLRRRIQVLRITPILRSGGVAPPLLVAMMLPSSSVCSVLRVVRPDPSYHTIGPSAA